MKKKVLFFSLGLVGGAERQTALISKMLDREIFDVNFVLVRRSFLNDANSLENFIPRGVKIINVAWKSQLKLFYDFFKILKFESPDVVFCSAMHLNLRLLILSVLFPKCRFVIRNENYLYTISDKKKFLMKIIYKLADKIVVQTDEMKSEIVGLGVKPEKVYMLQNAVDTDTIDEKLKDGNPYTTASRKFVASGRFSRQKGFDVLVNAFKLVSDLYFDVELYILGQKNGRCEEEYRRVEDIIKSNGLQDKVHCLGFQNNPYVYVNHADVFVLSSRNEGLPNVLIEALYMGVPVAATTCIPVIERIVNVGKNGFLAESENPVSLSKAMINALELKNIKSTYNSGSKDDFVSLFS